MFSSSLGLRFSAVRSLQGTARQGWGDEKLGQSPQGQAGTFGSVTHPAGLNPSDINAA
jgi:hypothetical protein